MPNRTGRSRAFLILIGIMLIPVSVRAELRYVDSDAMGSGSGLSWASAYSELRTALTAASSNAAITEIWVANGTYKPTAGTDPFATFQLRDGLAIHGGFAGFESELAQRDLTVGKTVLSGDIGVPLNLSDNVFHVVTGSGVDSTAVLEGVTIACGSASASSLTRRGGGLRIEGAGSAPTIVNCIIRDNIARDFGGGVYNSSGSPTFVNCVFRNNGTTAGDGAAVYSDAGWAKFINCTFLNNSATGEGGGVYTVMHSGPSCPDNANFFNCVFWGNTDGAPFDMGDQITVLENACPPEFIRAIAPNPFVLANSCIQYWDGVLGGPSNTGGDPMFVDADGRLGTGSAGIDLGDITALPADTLDLDSDGDTFESLPIDRDGRPRSVGVTVDAGAFEYGFDCNNNGVMDDVDIAGGTSADCNTNGVPDECDPATDCNSNGIADHLDIAAGTSSDCNSDCLPDECTPGDDCNANGTLDECELAAGSSSDCNHNALPDECEPDCNLNGTPDDCDISAGSSFDCNTNGIADECEPASGDCNDNDVPDSCELSAGSASDCDANGVLDECDIASGSASDCDGNLIPDACEIAQRFFMLDNTALLDPGAILRFDPASLGNVSTMMLAIPAGGNDRGLTVFDGEGQLLSCDEDRQLIRELDVFRGRIVRTIAVDRPLLELAYDWTTGQVYGTAVGGGLYRVNLTTGATTFVNALPGGSINDWVCLTYDDRSGKLLGASRSEGVVYALDPVTGAGTPFPGALGFPMGDLAVDLLDGRIYGVGLDGELYRVDRGTGEATPLGTALGISGTSSGLAILLSGDCTGNQILDRCEISAGSSFDCNGNALPDECDPDCNANGTIDACEALAPFDWNADGLTDVADYAGFPNCLVGPNQSVNALSGGCATSCLVAYDTDDDGDIDLSDFAALQSELE